MKPLPYLALALLTGTAAKGAPIPRLTTPPASQLVFEEDWASENIDPEKWYVLQKRWGWGDLESGVVKKNVFLAQDTIDGKRKNVLICRGHGDEYQGPVIGWQGRKTRVGGVIVSKPFFASGQFEVVMKIGSTNRTATGPKDPTHPIGMLPALWTYAYRWVSAGDSDPEAFHADNPLYNPLMLSEGKTRFMYWSELDFPEFGKEQNLEQGLYNTWLNLNHHSSTSSTKATIDAQYHTFTTLWRTELAPMENITDDQVIAHDGYWWIQDKTVPYEAYRCNPLKRLGKNRYALCQGKEVLHFIDGEYVGANRVFVPAMAAQLNMGVWFPHWAGAAPWGESSISISSVKVWQFDDPGDVRGILTEDLGNNMDENGTPIPQ